jgi:hypothetical protein
MMKHKPIRDPEFWKSKQALRERMAKMGVIIPLSEEERLFYEEKRSAQSQEHYLNCYSAH